MNRTGKQNERLLVDGDRLWQSLMTMAEIGRTANGGCNRQALTPADGEARDLFASWCREAGCALRIDDMGNIFARRAGRRGDAPPILIGSHLDTQPAGGRFDGVYGVLAGLEIVRTLNAAEHETEGPIDIVVWTNEEGCRFAPAMNGSGVWAGALERDAAHAQTASDDGSVFREALAAIGYLGAERAAAPPLHAAFEAHIEQGPVLEASGRQIGVVTGVQAMRWYDLAIDGVACHAGTTPMAMRHDPAHALGAILARYLDELDSLAGAAARATFGVIAATPGSRNTVPARCTASVDLRHPDDERLDVMEGALSGIVDDICAARGTRGVLQRIWTSPAVAFDATCIEAVRNASDALAYSSCDIVSGAGHDAVYVARVAPTAMVFVPCAGGLSHNEAESADPADLAAGANVMMHAVLARDGAR